MGNQAKKSGTTIFHFKNGKDTSIVWKYTIWKRGHWPSQGPSFATGCANPKSHINMGPRGQVSIIPQTMGILPTS